MTIFSLADSNEKGRTSGFLPEFKDKKTDSFSIGESPYGYQQVLGMASVSIDNTSLRTSLWYPVLTSTGITFTRIKIPNFKDKEDFTLMLSEGNTKASITS